MDNIYSYSINITNKISKSKRKKIKEKEYAKPKNNQMQKENKVE